MFQRALAAGAVPALIVLVGGLAFAAPKAFPAPNGWDQLQQQTPPGSQATYQAWKHNSGDLQQTVIVLDDPGQPYSDTVDRVHKNIVDNKFKVNLDKDQSCDGKTGHLFEIIYGPESKRIAVDRLVIPDGSGSVQITYMRPEPEPFAPEVKTEINTYCGTTVI